MLGRLLVRARVRRFNGQLNLSGTLPIGNALLPIHSISVAGKKMNLHVFSRGRTDRYKHWQSLLRRFENMYGLDVEFDLILKKPSVTMHFIGTLDGNALIVVVRGGFTI